MSIFIDQMGRKVLLPKIPERIVSIVPSQTELICDLGMTSNLVGRTKFCIHPKLQVSEIPVVGGTKNLRIDKIRELNPDLIIGNKEENDQEQIELLMQEFPVWMSDISTLDDAEEMIRALSQVFDVVNQGDQILNQLHKSIAGFSALKLGESCRVLYLIWNEPIMIAAKGTFIDAMIQVLGVENAAEKYQRYPEISEYDISLINPTHIFLSSEPFPFSEKHIARYQRICPNAVILIVDGELFSWYGSRLLKSLDYFKELAEKL